MQTDPARAHELSTIDRNGTLRIRGLTIPASDLWSPEFREFYATAAQASRPKWPIPARTASAAEWSKFDAWQDETFSAPRLAKVRERYGAHVAETTIAGVRAAVVTPQDGIAPENRRRVLLNLHGGAFAYNAGLTYALLESIPVAVVGCIKVITLDYRQAPFHQYSAASEDVHAVYEHLLEQYRPTSIGLFGCSAGGALAAQTLVRLQRRGIACPGAVGIFSLPVPPPLLAEPGVAGWGDSAIWFTGVAKNRLSSEEQRRWEPLRWYMERADANDPEAYPGSFDAVLADFPPTLLLSGTRDFALSAIARTHARLLKLGVDSSLYVMEGAMHAAHVVAIGTPEAHEAHAYTARWFAQHLET